METITIPLVFLAGVVSFASPCFLPIVPVFMTSLLGVDVSGSETQTKIPALAAAQGAGEGFLVPAGAGDAGQRAENGGWGCWPAPERPHGRGVWGGLVALHWPRFGSRDWLGSHQWHHGEGSGADAGLLRRTRTTVHPACWGSHGAARPPLLVH